MLYVEHERSQECRLNGRPDEAAVAFVLRPFALHNRDQRAALGCPIKRARITNLVQDNPRQPGQNSLERP
jgi:hypothetical protein